MQLLLIIAWSYLINLDTQESRKAGCVYAQQKGNTWTQTYKNFSYHTIHKSQKLRIKTISIYNRLKKEEL